MHCIPILIHARVSAEQPLCRVSFCDKTTVAGIGKALQNASAAYWKFGLSCEVHDGQNWNTFSISVKCFRNKYKSREKQSKRRSMVRLFKKVSLALIYGPPKLSLDLL